MVRLDDDDLNFGKVIDSMGREQEMAGITEPGMYTLVLRSNKNVCF